MRLFSTPVLARMALAVVWPMPKMYCRLYSTCFWLGTSTPPIRAAWMRSGARRGKAACGGGQAAGWRRTRLDVAAADGAMQARCARVGAPTWDGARLRSQPAGALPTCAARAAGTAGAAALKPSKRLGACAGEGLLGQSAAGSSATHCGPGVSHAPAATHLVAPHGQPGKLKRQGRHCVWCALKRHGHGPCPPSLSVELHAPCF